MIRFIPVAEITDARTLTIGLSGGSGTGKTFTALRIARGIAEAVTGKKAERLFAADAYKAFPTITHSLPIAGA